MGALSEESSGRGLGGIERRTLAKRISKSKEAVLGAMRQLHHPHVSEYESANLEELEEQLTHVARFYVKTWPGRTRPDIIDVVSKAVLAADVDATLVRRIFGGVATESDLTAPVEARLRRDGLQVKREVKVRGSRADLVGYVDGLFGRDVVAVELKNAPEECSRLVEQLKDYRRAADTVRVVMTPECHARVVLKRGELENPRAYEEFISKSGAELWIYDAVDESFTRIAGGTGDYDRADYNALWDSLKEKASQT
ncbi:hypothetical protein ACLESO_03270 [Pyxidicoccus sp. 3LG]